MSRIARNTIYNLAGQLTVAAISLVAVKNIYKELGEDVLGIVYFAQLIALLGTLFFEKSFRITIVREVSVNFNRDSAYTSKFIRMYSLILLAVFLLLSIGIYFGSPVIVEKWINLKTLPHGEAITIFRILGISSLIVIMRSLYDSVLIGIERMGVGNLIDVFTYGLQQLGVIMIIKSGGEVFHVVYWIAGWYVAGCLLAFAASAYNTGIMMFVPGYYPSAAKKSAEFNIKMLFAVIFSTLHRNVDRLAISKLLPVGMVGYYGVIHTIASRVTMFTDAVSKSSYPAACAAFKEGAGGFLSRYRKLHDAVCLANAPLLALFWFFSLPLLRYLFGEDNAAMLILPYSLLLLGFYLSSVVTVPWLFSLAAGRPEITARANLWALIIFLPVTVLLVWLFKLNGAGFSWVFYNVFYMIYAVPRICKTCLGIAVSDWYRHVFQTVAVTFSPYVAAGFYLWFFGETTVFSIALVYVAASLVFLFIAWKTTGVELRETVLKFAGSVFAR